MDVIDRLQYRRISQLSLLLLPNHPMSTRKGGGEQYDTQTGDIFGNPSREMKPRNLHAVQDTAERLF